MKKRGRYHDMAVGQITYAIILAVYFLYLLIKWLLQ